MPKDNPMTDVQTLRARARRDVESGAVTQGYKADRAKVVDLLNAALATELVCALRYRFHYFAASGIHSESVKQEFLQHATQELEHADMLAKRIIELGGSPNFSPVGMMDRSHSEYVEGKTITDMLRADLVAERVAIESYTEMIAYVGGDDPTTRRVLEAILAVEEEHAEDLKSLMENG
jgi:bacterioferritin